MGGGSPDQGDERGDGVTLLLQLPELLRPGEHGDVTLARICSSFSRLSSGRSTQACQGAPQAQNGQGVANFRQEPAAPALLSWTGTSPPEHHGGGGARQGSMPRTCRLPAFTELAPGGCRCSKSALERISLTEGHECVPRASVLGKLAPPCPTPSPHLGAPRRALQGSFHARFGANFPFLGIFVNYLGGG